MSTVRFSEIVGPAFFPVIHDIFDPSHPHSEYMLAGGRGSLKSSCISFVVPTLIMQDKDYNALVLRKVGNTLRDSVYSQCIWALDKLGVADYWTARVSPMELIYKPTGQRILFRGTDDPLKLKSIKVPHGYIAVTWFEELDQFSGSSEIRSILQSTQRGGDRYWNFESYNPPKTAANWANEEFAKAKPNRLTHKSTYLEAPPEWLGPQLIAEAEHLKASDEVAYRHEFLGEVTGTGTQVFDRLESQTITADQIKTFDRIYQGADWGWYPDPYCFVRLHYDAARETIWIIDEHYGNKMPNSATAKWIKDHGYTDTYVTCDSAEQKSVSDYVSAGIPARAAIKGPGSVDYSYKWLSSRRIIIDPARTPHAWAEFSRYEYDTDKYGTVISGYPDRDNHAIDSCRYATECLWRSVLTKA